MSYPGPSHCRVSLHADTDAGTRRVDLVLPAGMPVAELVPSVVDMVRARGGGRHSTRTAAPYRLSRPGSAALDGAKTLAQQGIRDGETLLLVRAPAGLPAPRFDDSAERVAATVRETARPWTPTLARCTGALAGTWLTGVGVVALARWDLTAGAVTAAAAAGCALVAATLARRVHEDADTALALALSAVVLAAAAGGATVPGAPGAAHVLLAAVAAVAASVLSMQLAGCRGPTVTAVCCAAALVAVAALAATLTEAPPQVIGAATAVAAIALLHKAARLSILLAGPGRRPGPPLAGPDDAAVRAHGALTGLVVGCSTVTVLGVAAAAVHTGGTPRFGGAALAAVSAAVLLLRARTHTDRRQIVALVAGGIAAGGVCLASAAGTVPRHGPWLGGTAVALAGAALYLGFTAPALSPIARRGVDLLEHLALAAVLPVTCWVCGCYEAVRGLNLT